jgi:hypothetical protein
MKFWGIFVFLVNVNFEENGCGVRIFCAAGFQIQLSVVNQGV